MTKTKENLVGILKENFKVKYCFETILNRNIKFSAAIPMVCFCDIPLSELKNHIVKYGNYGIGLKKEWGKRKRLNPILYLDNDSFLSENIIKVARSILKGGDVNAYDDMQNCIFDFFRYSKNYEGSLNSNNIGEKYRFSDEREWRYVPPKEKCHTAYLKEEYKNRKEEINQSISALYLDFSPNDINYIILNSESEIQDFVNIFKINKNKLYNQEQIDRLITRIITTEQILTDF